VSGVTEHQQYPWFERRTFLRGVVGSTAHGLHTDDGVDDRDEMGVCIEPMANMVGQSEFEQVIYRTAAERTGKHDAPSQAGDLDLVVYSLRKWTRLALHGNPTVLLLLYLPQELCVVRNALAGQLQELAPYFVSREAGQRFLGYLTAQKQRLLGERGTGRHGAPREELVQKYGFDTKFAMHMVRLGIQGVEFLRTGRLTLPMAEPERSWIRSIRVGKVPLQEVLTRAGELEREIKDLIDGGPLPYKANSEPVWAWVRSVYLEWWKCEAFDGQVQAFRDGANAERAVTTAASAAQES
jgi:hypothetical protein